MAEQRRNKPYKNEVKPRRSEFTKKKVKHEEKNGN